MGSRGLRRFDPVSQHRGPGRDITGSARSGRAHCASSHRDSDRSRAKAGRSRLLARSRPARGDSHFRHHDRPAGQAARVAGPGPDLAERPTMHALPRQASARVARLTARRRGFARLDGPISQHAPGRRRVVPALPQPAGRAEPANPHRALAPGGRQADFRGQSPGSTAISATRASTAPPVTCAATDATARRSSPRPNYWPYPATR